MLDFPEQADKRELAAGHGEERRLDAGRLPIAAENVDIRTGAGHTFFKGVVVDHKLVEVSLGLEP